MVKVEVINQNVTIKEFNRLYNIKRKNPNNSEPPNYLKIGDVFECDGDMAEYLSGELKEQPIKAVKVLEVIPEEKPIIKKTSKKNTRKVQKIDKESKK